MSTREEVLPDRRGWRRLSYTRRCGWVDWGHARPGAALGLKRQLETESADLPALRGLPLFLAGRPAFAITFGEGMTKFHVTVSNVAHFVVRRGMSPLEKAEVALAIFERVSLRFEALQASAPFRWTSDSGFSAEDLVSDLIGFYGVYRLLDDVRLRVIAGEVSVGESLRIWDENLPNGIGGIKNYGFAPILFPTKEGAHGPADTSWPAEFGGLTPAPPGRDWVAVRRRFLDGALVNARVPLDVSREGEVTARPVAGHAAGG